MLNRRWKNSIVEKEHRKNSRHLERQIHYRFRNTDLLLNALKHRSFLDVSGEKRILSNERLEFLGDAVLNLIVSEHFYHFQTGGEEGALTNSKSTLVSGTVLADQARKIDLGKYLLLSENEARSGGRDRDSILEDAFEALIGAIYLDRGLKHARKFVQQFLLADSHGILSEKSHRNYKSVLQEHLQGVGSPLPVYEVVEENGPDHNKRYTVEVRLGEEILGVGSGRTKKDAEQRAAREGIKKVNNT